MWAWIAVLLMAFLPDLVWGQDVPAGFQGSQFIDSEGCVFVKDDAGWQARLDPDGQHICGFPPSPTAVDVPQAPFRSVEERLGAALADGLRDGDLLLDRREMAERKEPLPQPAQSELQDRIAQQAGALEAVRVAVAAAGKEASALCDRLGYVPTAQATPIIGGDVTQGMCPGMRAPLPDERLVSPPVVRHRSEQGKAAQSGEKQTQTERRPIARPNRQMTASSPTRTVGPRKPEVRESRLPRTQPSKGGELIPANARFVQIGSFADDANATIAIRKLSRMGYRVTQTHIMQDDQQKRLIMAGPFRDRQALIMALNHLRQNGYPKAVAR